MNSHKGFPPSRAVGFLLAQVGAHAAGKFAERLAPLNLKPSDAGLLRILGASEGMSQQALASRLRINPSRLVGLVDALETRGLVERRENPQDRRTYALHLTAPGRAVLHDIGRISRAHSDAICAALNTEEREMLANL